MNKHKNFKKQLNGADNTLQRQHQRELGDRYNNAQGRDEEYSPFKNFKLKRDDVEWLLAAHEKRLLLMHQSKGLDLRGADLKKADLHGLSLQGVDLRGAHLEGANLENAHLEEAKLQGIFLDKETNLSNVTLAKKDLRVGPWLADVHWGDANIAVMNWESMTMLGDEYEAQQLEYRDGNQNEKDKKITAYQIAARANRQLSLVLQSQGLDEKASHFAYCAQVLQREGLLLQIHESRKLQSLLNAFMVMAIVFLFVLWVIVRSLPLIHESVPLLLQSIFTDIFGNVIVIFIITTLFSIPSLLYSLAMSIDLLDFDLYSRSLEHAFMIIIMTTLFMINFVTFILLLIYLIPFVIYIYLYPLTYVILLFALIIFLLIRISRKSKKMAKFNSFIEVLYQNMVSHTFIGTTFKIVVEYTQYYFSLFLDLLAGYGYKPRRSLLIYLLVIAIFTATYYAIGRTIGPHLSPLAALVFSVTSFHGRGFFPGPLNTSNSDIAINHRMIDSNIAIDHPMIVLAALEAVIGLLIEISFIATFTQRFFGK